MVVGDLCKTVELLKMKYITLEYYKFWEKCVFLD